MRFKHVLLDMVSVENLPVSKRMGLFGGPLETLLDAVERSRSLFTAVHGNACLMFRTWENYL